MKQELIERLSMEFSNLRITETNCKDEDFDSLRNMLIEIRQNAKNRHQNWLITKIEIGNGKILLEGTLPDFIEKITKRYSKYFKEYYEFIKASDEDFKGYTIVGLDLGREKVTEVFEKILEEKEEE